MAWGDASVGGSGDGLMLGQGPSAGPVRAEAVPPLPTGDGGVFMCTK
jgi:hypothetical protein